MALVERGRYRRFQPGETLPPHVGPLLQQLGVWERFTADGYRPSFGIQSAWGSPSLDETTFLTSPHGHGWHLDRARFDRMLLDAAARAGAAVELGCHVGEVTRTEGGFRVHAQRDAERIVLEARRLVDASGRAAVIARALGERWSPLDTMVALIAEMAPPTRAEEVPASNCLLLESTPDGWWYSTPLASGALLVTYLTDADVVRAHPRGPVDLWEERLRETVHTVARLAGDRARVAFHVRKAESGRLSSASGPGWIAAGDAASAYDPLSAAGITKAIASGIDAADALARDLLGDRDALRACAERSGRAFARYLRGLRVQYRREVRWSTSPFWRRRQAEQK